MHFNPVIIWFIAGLILILLEFLIPGVILVFFGLGAWVVVLTTWTGLTGGLTSQLLLFAAASIVLLVTLRRRFRARFIGFIGDGNEDDHNLDEFAGQVVKVIVDIDPENDDGRVEFKGASWKAVADSPIPAGRRAVIVAVEGIQLRVRPE